MLDDYFWEITSGWMPYSARYLVRQWIHSFRQFAEASGVFQLPRSSSTLAVARAGWVLLFTIHLELCSSTWRIYRCRLEARGDSTGAVLVKVHMPSSFHCAVLGQVVHARCCVWCRWPDSAENCAFSAAAFHRLSSGHGAQRVTWSCCSADHGFSSCISCEVIDVLARRYVVVCNDMCLPHLQFINKVVIFHFVAQRLFPVV